MRQANRKNRGLFLTPEEFAREQIHRMESPRGNLILASCRSGMRLAREVAERYRELQREAGSKSDFLFLQDIDSRFTDSETCVSLKNHISGYDVYLFQCLFDPTSERSVDQNYMAFLIAARAFREHGASHITAVLPYLAYSRQDKPSKFEREPTTARLMADMSIAAGIDRLVSWDPHSGQIHGFYGELPLTLLSPLTMFGEEYKRFRDNDEVVAIAPDVGASKKVTHFSRMMNISSAIASKYRPRTEEVVVSEIIGDLKGKKTAIILDDIISGGGTVYELVKKVVSETQIREVYLCVSHNLCVGEAFERLLELHERYCVKEIMVTNSIPQMEKFSSLPFVRVRCLSDILSRTINRIHYNRSISALFYRQ